MDYVYAGPVTAAAPVAQAFQPQAEKEYGAVSSLEPLGLPNGFPSVLNHPLAWKGEQFQHESDFIVKLTEADLVEVKHALAAFKAHELDGDLISRETFPLPTLGPKLSGIGREVYDCKGFSVIRGIDPTTFSVEDLTTVWLGFQAYIAEQSGCQDHKGNMLVHIVADPSSEITREHHRHSTAAITFHNEEAGDVVAWLTRSIAAAGGKCIIASAYNVYNVIAEHRPDIIRTLAKSTWPFAMPHFNCRPIIFHHDSKMIMNFGRTPLVGSAAHPRPEHFPKITDQQREALDVVEAVAKMAQLEIQTQAGDMHFINNFAVLHRREGFVDGQSSLEKRHLVRMRLRSSELAWKVPVELKRDWDDAFENQAVTTWHLEPMPAGAFPLRKYTN